MCIYVCVVSNSLGRKTTKWQREEWKRREEQNIVSRWMKEQPSIHSVSQRDNSSLSQSSPTAADIFIQIIIIYILIKNHHYVDHLHPNEMHLHGNHSTMVLWQRSIVPFHRQIKRRTEWTDREIKAKWNETTQSRWESAQCLIHFDIFISTRGIFFSTETTVGTHLNK